MRQDGLCCVYVLQSRSSDASSQWARLSQRHEAGMQRDSSAHGHSVGLHSRGGRVAPSPATAAAAASPGTSTQHTQNVVIFLQIGKLFCQLPNRFRAITIRMKYHFIVIS